MTDRVARDGCLFCDRTQHEEVGASASWRVLFDNFPANPGHALLVPKRHVESVFDLCGDEAAEVHGVRLYARNLVVARLGHTPDGWTIGTNEGRAAGRSVDHVHEHLIPRYVGDVPDPRGGIRQCAPNCDPDAWMASPDRPGDPQHTGGNAEDYTAGYEMGLLDGALAAGPMRHETTIHSANATQADLIAMRRGYVCQFDPSPEFPDWTHATFTPQRQE